MVNLSNNFLCYFSQFRTLTLNVCHSVHRTEHLSNCFIINRQSLKKKIKRLSQTSFWYFGHKFGKAFKLVTKIPWTTSGLLLSCSVPNSSGKLLFTTLSFFLFSQLLINSLTKSLTLYSSSSLHCVYSFVLRSFSFLEIDS